MPSRDGGGGIAPAGMVSNLADPPAGPVIFGLSGSNGVKSDSLNDSVRGADAAFCDAVRAGFADPRPLAGGSPLMVVSQWSTASEDALPNVNGETASIRLLLSKSFVMIAPFATVGSATDTKITIHLLIGEAPIRDG